MSFAPIARSGVLAVLLAAGVFPSAAFAAEPPAAASDLDQARKLGTQALEAQDAKDFAQAERLFTDALKLYDAPTLRLGRARASVELGHWLAAREDYRAVIAAGTGAAETEAFAQARSAAEAELGALLPRIPKLTVEVAGDPVPVTVDGRAWSSRGAEPIDPGAHRVRAQFPAGPVVRELTILEGTTQRVELQAPAPQVAAAPAAAQPAPAPAAATEPVKASATDDAPGNAAPDNTATWVGVITTGALVVGAVVTGIVTLNKRAEYSAHNRSDVPYAKKRDLRNTANAWAWVNTGLTAGAVVSAGITTFVVLNQAPSSPSSAKPAQADGLVFGIAGRF